MKFKELLSKNKQAILERWFNAILETYPADTSKFLKNQKDRFANPVGFAISQGIGDIFGELMSGLDEEKVSPFLDNIIRVRAVQGFTPKEAVSFIFSLKDVIREALKDETTEDPIYDELSEFDSRIDDLALLAFDIYMRCREKIYEIKANELRNSTFRLLQRANLICEAGEQDNEENENILKVKRKEVTE